MASSQAWSRHDKQALVVLGGRPCDVPQAWRRVARPVDAVERQGERSASSAENGRAAPAAEEPESHHESAGSTRCVDSYRLNCRTFRQTLRQERSYTSP